MEDQDFIVFGAPDIRDAEIREVVDTLKSGWIGTGPKVSKFEQAFADFKGVSPRNTLALNSCSSALHLALVVAGVKDGDEVITTATTFCATINAIIHTGAKPVLVDIEPTTRNIDVTRIEDYITENTKAILPVHLAGVSCDMEFIVQLAKKYNLIIIEDCAHAIESEYKDQKIGTIGDFGCFSFYTTKNIVTGEGGMLIAKDEEKLDLARKLSLQGMDNDAWKRFGSEGYKHYSIHSAGYKYNMTDLNASLGIHQLSRVDELWLRRQQIHKYYLDSLKNLPVKLPSNSIENSKHGYHLFSIQINEDASKISRDDFMLKMRLEDIGTGVHYRSIADYQYYIDSLNLDPNDYAASKVYGNQTVSLPFSGSLSDVQVDRVIEATKKALKVSYS